MRFVHQSVLIIFYSIPLISYIKISPMIKLIKIFNNNYRTLLSLLHSNEVTPLLLSISSLYCYNSIVQHCRIHPIV